MAIEVRIPTILRTYTDGQKAVSAEGDTLAGLIDNLESDHPGIKERLVDGESLRRFVNVYVNDEDVRFLGGLEASLDDGDQVVVLRAGRIVEQGATADVFANPQHPYTAELVAAMPTLPPR